MHGAEFYASKRHKGEHFDSDPKPASAPENRLNHTKRMQQKSAVQSGARGAVNHGGAITSTGSSPRKEEADCSLPISDNNVSTTAIEEAAEQWENDNDINVRFILFYRVKILSK